MARVVFETFKIMSYKKLYCIGIFVPHLVKELPPPIGCGGSLPVHNYTLWTPVPS
jgi:hypothetical protein